MYLVFGIVPVSTVEPTTGVQHFAIASTKVVANTPPTMTAPLIEGALGVTKVLTAVPQGFNDPDNSGEGAHVTQWFRSDDAAGEVNRVNVGTGLTYTVQLPDLYKHVGFEITPVDGLGGVGTLVRTVGAKIPNTPPSIKNFRFNPAPPQNHQNIAIEFEFVDPDGDLENPNNKVEWFLCDSNRYIEGNVSSASCNQNLDYNYNKTKPWGKLEAEGTYYWRTHVVVKFRPRALTGVEYGEWLYMKSDFILGTPPKMTTPQISGVPAIGQTITGVPQGFSDIEDVVYVPGIQVHRWYRTTDPTGVDGRGDPIATTANYAVTAADKNFYLVYEVTPATDRGAPFTGTPVFTVTPLIPDEVSGSAPTVVSTTITGNWQVGDTLTAHYDFDDPDNDLEDTGAAVMQWYVSHPATGAPTAVAGATGTTFTLRAEDEGESRTVWFNVEKVKSLTGLPNETTRPENAPVGTWYARRTGAIRLPTVMPVARPSLFGQLIVDEQQVGEPNYTGPQNIPQASTYRWFRADDAAGTLNRVPIASGVTRYTPTEAELRKFLVFETTPRTTTGLEGTTVAVTGVRPVFRQYSNETKTTPVIQPGDAFHRDLEISGRTGNGHAQSYVDWGMNSIAPHRLRTELIAPDGTAYLLRDYGSSSQWGGATLDLSSEPMNGTWRLRITCTPTETQCAPSFQHLRIYF